MEQEHDQPFSDEPQSMMDDEESRPLYGGEVIEEIERLRSELAVAEAFHKVVVAERNHERAINARLRADKRKLIDQLRYIRTHLYVATVQRSPADDRIIADHIEQAYLRTNEVIMEMEKTGD